MPMERLTDDDRWRLRRAHQDLTVLAHEAGDMAVRAAAAGAAAIVAAALADHGIEPDLYVAPAAEVEVPAG